MMKRFLIYTLLLMMVMPVLGQQKQETTVKREITLYNPYKPSLPDVVRKSFLPDMTDTAKVRPDFKYEVRTFPFSPPYKVNPIKPAALMPDPLPKLYNSYLLVGLGSYLTPVGEISITNQRSKKGNIGFYARHFSTNGKVKLDNDAKAFAGYMDNDAMFYGRKFFRKSIFKGDLDFSQKSRYAYGYDTSFVSYEPSKKDVRLNYINTGASLGYTSMNLDSSKLAYDFGLDYHFFTSGSDLLQHSVEFDGKMSKLYKGFYVGGKLDFGYYMPSLDGYLNKSKFIAGFSPFVYKKSSEWNFKLGFQVLADQGLESVNPEFHIYPDVAFGFSIVPSYLGFFAELTGNLKQNEPAEVIDENPFLVPGDTLYALKSTNNALNITAGIRGETGVEGYYRLSASYSIVEDMLFFANTVLRDGTTPLRYGNYFHPLYDEVEILNVHGNWSGKIADKIALETSANYYKYTLGESSYAWNLPDWDAKIGFKYNLREKVLAEAGLVAAGARHMLVKNENINPVSSLEDIYKYPASVTLNLGAEYRYSKILSFWLKFNNITFGRYYEWAYYPGQRFIFQAGFSYSL